MKKRRASLISDPVLVWVITFIVVLLVVFFLVRSRFDLWVKNLPDYQLYDSEDIQIVPDEVQVPICPDNYVVVGRFESGTSNSFFFAKEGNSYKKTFIEWLTDRDKVIINKFGWFREIKLGSNDQNGSHELVIDVDDSIFTRGSQKFIEVLRQELTTGEELFKYLILIDDGIIKGLGGPNYVCQKREVLDNLDKKLNLIYWGVEDVEPLFLQNLKGYWKGDYFFIEYQGLYPYISWLSVDKKALIDYLFPVSPIFISTNFLIKKDNTFHLRIEESRDIPLFSWSEEKIYEIGGIEEKGRISLLCKIDDKGKTTFIKDEYYDFLLEPKVIIKYPCFKKFKVIDKEKWFYCDTNLFLNQEDVKNSLS